jgi:hypothetical protein
MLLVCFRVCYDVFETFRVFSQEKRVCYYVFEKFCVFCWKKHVLWWCLGSLFFFVSCRDYILCQ